MRSEVRLKNEIETLFGACDQRFLASVRLKEADDCIRRIFEHGLQQDLCEINSIGKTKPLYLQKDAFLILANDNELIDNLILRLSSVGKGEHLY